MSVPGGIVVDDGRAGLYSVVRSVVIPTTVYNSIFRLATPVAQQSVPCLFSLLLLLLISCRRSASGGRLVGFGFCAAHNSSGPLCPV